MKIIVIEGLDKSGKHTASLEATKYLKELGYKAIHSEFPRYDTPTGKLIKEYLHGEYKVDRATAELLQATDKQSQQNWFKELENANYDFLVLDRYIHTQLAYGLYFKEELAKENLEKKYELKELTDVKKERLMEIEIDKTRKWLYSLIRTLRKPDYIIYLDVSPDESMKRKGEHGDNDNYESDKNLLSGVREQFKPFTLHTNFDRIDANKEKEEVKKEVLQYLDKYLKIIR